MSNNDFRVISVDYKIPLYFRRLFIVSLIILILIIEISIYWLKGFSSFMFITFSLLLLIWLGRNYLRARKYYFSSPPLKLNRYIWNNNLYRAEKVKHWDKNGDSFYSDEIISSAQLGYKQNDDYLIIRFFKNADIYTDKANTYEVGLSALFGLPVFKKIDDVSYCDYYFELVPDERLRIGENYQHTNKYEIELTKKLKWEIGSPPHQLITGSTNSGKSFWLFWLALSYAKFAEIYVADPKAADVAILGWTYDYEMGVKHTATEPEEILKQAKEINDKMETRYRKYFADKSTFGKIWKDIPNLEPIVWIFDEYAAFVAVSDKKIVKELEGYLYNLVLRGRQAGIEIVLVLQRPDTQLISGALRDQFGVRIALANLSPEGRIMMFGRIDKEYRTISQMGGGYTFIESVTTEPTYFETPIFPAGIDVLAELEKVLRERKERDAENF